MFEYGIVDVDGMLDGTHYNIKWKLDMSQIPPIFSEKRNYQTAWMTDNQMAAAIATTVLFGVPIITTTHNDNLLGLNA
jgi:hypothetical protein